MRAARLRSSCGIFLGRAVNLDVLLEAAGDHLLPLQSRVTLLAVD